MKKKNFEFDEIEAIEFEKEIENDIEKDKGKTIEEEEVNVESSLSMFFKEMKQYPMLTKEQERELTKIAQDGKKESERKKAKERLWLCNWRLAVYVAKKFRGLGVEFEDLVSQGMMGLKNGIDKFDYKEKTRLSTYVLYWIKQSISRYIDDNSRTIRLPVHVNDKINKLNKAKKELSSKLGREPELKEVAKYMKVSLKEIEGLVQVSMETTSLDKEIGDEEETKLMDLVADQNAISPEENAEKLSIMAKLHEAIASLKEKEQQVINLRYGQNDDVNRTLEEVGSIMGITRERVRQIETIAFKKIKRKYPELEAYVA